MHVSQMQFDHARFHLLPLVITHVLSICHVAKAFGPTIIVTHTP